MKLKRITRIGDEARGMKKLHIPALVFSRMDSTRLPGKALLDLDGTPVLGRVLARLKMSNEIDGIIVCTTTRSIDGPIAEFAITSDVQLIRGDTFDVMDRAKTAAVATKADAIVRISGDSPFIDPDLVDTMVSMHRKSPCDLTTNVYPRSFPPGMSVEVINAETLDMLDQQALSAANREHITTYFYRHADQFKINNHTATTPSTDVDLALDTKDNFVFQNWLAAQIPDDANLSAILAAARRYTDRPLKDAS